MSRRFLHDLEPIRGMIFCSEIGVRQHTFITFLTEGSGAGVGAARFNRTAISWIACMVVSPSLRVENAVFGGFDSSVTMSVAACRRWSSRDVSGTGTVLGKKATVSEMQVARVEGT